MKYLIAHVIKDPLNHYQEGLINQLSWKFNLRNINKRIVPHLTIKVPFTTSRIKEIGGELETLTKNFPYSKYKVGGFSHFNRKVVFLDIEAENSIKDFSLQVQKRLKKFSEVQFSEYENGDMKFHATLCYTNKNNFSRIWSYLQRKDEPTFEQPFDNICILRRNKDRWEKYREFNFYHNNQ